MDLRSFCWPARAWLVTGLVLLAGAPLVLSACDDKKSASPVKTETPPTPEPPTTEPAEPEPEPPVERYGELLARDMPELPTTQPLMMRLPLESAAKIEFNQPVHLDSSGRIWITDERGVSVDDLIQGDRDNLRPGDYIVKETVVFARWFGDHEGEPAVQVITKDDDGKYRWHHRLGVAELPDHDYQFDDAFLYGGAIATPTAGGVAVLQLVDRPDVETYLRRYGPRFHGKKPDANGRVEAASIQLADSSEAGQIRLDGKGLIAWVPCVDQLQTSKIASYDGEQWVALSTDDGWMEHPLHIMPLSDGTVLQLGHDAQGEHALVNTTLHELPVDPAPLEEAVKDLSSPRYDLREAAMDKLRFAGSAAWPILERLRDDQPIDGQNEIDILLLERTRPSLGGVVPEPGPVQVRSHLGDGGVLLEFPKGVVLPNDAGVYTLRAPAFINIRPGLGVRQISRQVEDLLETFPDASMFVWGDEIVVTGTDRPPLRWMSNHFEPITEAGLAMYDDLIGIDRDGRWILRDHTDAKGATLVVDTRLSNRAPKMVTWQIHAGEDGRAGWDKNDWPAVDNESVWRINEFGWQALEDQEEEIFTERDESAEAVIASGSCVSPNGSRYTLNGRTLNVHLSNNRQYTFTLPEAVELPTDADRLRMAADDDGHLYLFNMPGMITQLDVAAGQLTEKMQFEGDLPIAWPGRVWLDPSGRLCATYFGDVVILIWPDARVPDAIRPLIPSKHREDEPGPMPGGA